MPKQIKISPRLQETAHVLPCNWPSCGAACCLYGAWVDKIHAEHILENADLIRPWMEPGQADPHTWFDGQEEKDAYALSGRVRHTTVIPSPEHYGGTACIFLRADLKCALQAAAEANNMHKWALKPFYCVLHPLEFNLQGMLTIDEPAEMTAEKASCLRRGEEEVLLREVFKEELEYLLNLDSSEGSQDG